jgi:hypothetical protein
MIVVAYSIGKFPGSEEFEEKLKMQKEMHFNPYILIKKNISCKFGREFRKSVRESIPTKICS